MNNWCTPRRVWVGDFSVRSKENERLSRKVTDVTTMSDVWQIPHKTPSHNMLNIGLDVGCPTRGGLCDISGPSPPDFISPQPNQAGLCPYGPQQCALLYLCLAHWPAMSSHFWQQHQKAHQEWEPWRCDSDMRCSFFWLAVPSQDQKYSFTCLDSHTLWS